MPILKREPDVFPPDLFSSRRKEESWWVVHVRSRQEKRLARLLTQQGIGHYLPKAERRVRREGRTIRSYPPLFPGYLFFRGTANERIAAVRSNLTVRVLAVENQAGLDGELRELRRLQETGVSLAPHPYIGPGDTVHIREGAFRGYRGTVLREKGFTRLVVSISFLRRSVAAEMDREAIEPTGLRRRKSAAL